MRAAQGSEHEEEKSGRDDFSRRQEKEHRFLLLEDDSNDVELIRRALTSQWPNCELVSVESGPAYEKALRVSKFDLVLCDYCLPGFGGMEALVHAREHCPEVPVIFVSGGIGEETAIDGLKAGATDYVLKDHLKRLAPAVKRALKERAERVRRKRAEARMVRFQNRLVEANRDLTRRNQEIQSFYHTLSHELKTPLTAAREFVSIVLDGLAGPLEPKQRQYLTTALGSCEQLRLCIDDLLDATRLETGKLALDFKLASIEGLVSEAIKVIERKAEAKGIRLELEIEPMGKLFRGPAQQHRPQLQAVVASTIPTPCSASLAAAAHPTGAIQSPGHPTRAPVCRCFLSTGS